MAELDTRIQVLKIFTFVLGVVILGVGLDSHFNSSWNDLQLRKRLCSRVTASGRSLPCPSIAMEHYFVSAIIICFSLSLVGNATAYLGKLDYSSRQWKAIDYGFHVVGAVALLAAGIVYGISAFQIYLLVEFDVRFASFGTTDWKQTEKLISGGLTILQACLYAGIADVIGEQ